MGRFAMIWMAFCAGTLNPLVTRADSTLAQQPPVVLTHASTTEQVLDALQADGENLQSFSADLKREDHDTVMGSDVTHFGKVWFQIKPAGDPVMRVLMDHKQKANKQTPEKKEYQLDRGWLTDRDYDITTENRIQIVPAGQKMNLFQMGKGPFPLPIGQDKKDVQAEFAVKVLPPDKDDPANSIHLELKPLPKSSWSQKLNQVEVWVDLKTNMPVRIFTADSETEKTTDLLNLKLNGPIDAKDLELLPIGKGWKSKDTPLK